MNPRKFAIEITSRLQEAGYTALFAGGCVRDALLDRKPKDYDVATSATPDQVQQLFGRKRTLAIGKAFGVITVLAPKGADPIEVATFRRDSGYSDGRRPDSVEFTDAREDAIRRDFTINGMFYDPIVEEVIDYVGGQEDLAMKVVRAIGDPDERIEEDKLRMLRGIRFAATFGFDLESNTLAAIQKRAGEISVVSPERIGNELRRMLAHNNKDLALGLLWKSKLWREIVPSNEMVSQTNWDFRKEMLRRLNSNDFATVIHLLFSHVLADSIKDRGRPKFLSQLQSAWRLTNDEVDRAEWIARHHALLTNADEKPWSEIQPLLLSPHVKFALDVADVLYRDAAGIKFCRERLGWPAEKLNPTPLTDGGTLKSLGITPGPQFKELLSKVRALQLDGKLQTVEAAKEWLIANK
jgi:tRNA nucleotidyltransferase/poly(A) polymerase